MRGRPPLRRRLRLDRLDDRVAATLGHVGDAGVYDGGTSVEGELSEELDGQPASAFGTHDHVEQQGRAVEGGERTLDN